MRLFITITLKLRLTRWY